MIRRVLCCIAAILAASGALGARAEYHGELIRLHVKAASDSEEDQAFKLRVRDGVLTYVQALLAECESADEAYALISEGEAGILAAARAVADAEGYEGAIRVETGVCSFPEREYDGATVPAGDYRALRVVIGAGAGHNWWCVLYPTLCSPDPATEDVVYYSAVVEWLMNLFGGGAQ